MGFLQVLRFPPKSKDVQVRWIGHANLPLSVRGISRVRLGGIGLGGVVVGAGSMGRIVSFCTIGILCFHDSSSELHHHQERSFCIELV